MTVQVHIITLTMLTILSIPTLACLILMVWFNINDLIQELKNK